jgi:hypothetical protein
MQLAPKRGGEQPHTRLIGGLPTGLAGAVFWLALWSGLLWLLRQTSADGAMLTWMQLLVGLALIGLAIPLAWRILHQRLLWSLRNKLTLTYLLIGLAPFLLMLTFGAISAYIAAGQFSIHLADTRMRQELDGLGVNSAARAGMMARMERARAEGGLGPPRRPGPRPAPPTAPPAVAQSTTPASAATAQTETSMVLPWLHSPACRPA